MYYSIMLLFQDRSVAFMCLRRNHDCYFYNMTGQERQDVHDHMKIFIIEVSDILSLYVRENRKDNQEWTTQKHVQHWGQTKNQLPSHLHDHSAFLLIRTTLYFT